MGRAKTVTAAVALLVFLGAAPVPAQEEVALQGTAGDDRLIGTDADEALYGRAGNDILDGAGGNDTLDPGIGADSVSGGPGRDALVYSGSAPVFVSFNQIADDGPARTANIASDVEDVYTGDGPDRVSGTDGQNTLDGGDGDDRLTGARGADSLLGGDGDDTLDARDGSRDALDCGPGEDTAIVDEEDVVDNCERTERGGRVGASLAYQFRKVARGLKATRLTVTEATIGGTIKLSCRGRSCPFSKAQRITVKRTRVPLVSRLKGRTLRPGTRIRVVISAQGLRSATRELTIRSSSVRERRS